MAKTLCDKAAFGLSFPRWAVYLATAKRMLKCCLLVRYYKCQSCLRRSGCIGTDTLEAVVELKAVAGKATVEMHDKEQTLRALTCKLPT